MEVTANDRSSQTVAEGRWFKMLDDNQVATAVMDLLDGLDPEGKLIVTRLINQALGKWAMGVVRETVKKV